MSIKIEDFAGKELIFSASHMVELFPAPIPQEASEYGGIDTADDLFRLSNRFGYDEFFVNETDWVHAECEGEHYRFPNSDFLRWQLEKVNAETLWQLINKTDARVERLLDEDLEYEKDPEYNPEGWLDVYSRNEYPGKGIAFIQRLRDEVPDLFYPVLIKAILDERFGILNSYWYEFEIDENLDAARQAYSAWDVPLMIVYEGDFAPYIGAEYTRNILMDDYRVMRTYIRNYDEGEPS